MSRDRFATRAAILEAAERIIASHGVAELGVNSLATAAGCDKVLIYRYFGGLDGVLSALGDERRVWPTVGVGGEEGLAEAVRALLLEEWAAIAAGGLERESAAAEASGGRDGPLARAVAGQRAESHERIVRALREAHRIPPYIDLPALVELVSAALTMFALRSRTPVAGRGTGAPPPVPLQSIDPATAEGWRRVEKMVWSIVRALLDTGV